MTAGVHSIERSAQEDSLLVLFNAALSNMVRLPILTRITTLRASHCLSGFVPEQLCHVQGYYWIIPVVPVFGNCA